MARTFERIDDNPHTKAFFFEGGTTGVLLIHGFTGSPGTMKKIGETLSGDGYTVSGICLPGHGTHITDMEKADWKQWLEAAREGLTQLQKKCDKVIVCGLSMGGLLTLILAKEYSVNGAISIASAVDITDPFAKFAFFMKHFIRYKGSGIRDKDSHPYEIGYTCTPVGKVPDLLKLQKLANNGIEDITCPLLIIHSKKDRVVPVRAAQLIYDKSINVKDKRIFYLEESKHLCTVQPEFDVLIENIRTFISEHTK
ncbi:MAG: alpha/beta fold hydrolase [Clostridiales bacterium]|nr:alpha/beta fold hydrolase [Clostridiales bacterium]